MSSLFQMLLLHSWFALVAVSNCGSKAVLCSMVSSAGRGLSSGGVRPHFLQCKYKFPQNNSTASLSKISKHQGPTVLHLLCLKTSYLTGEGTHGEKRRCWQWCTVSFKDLCYWDPRRKPCLNFSCLLLFLVLLFRNLTVGDIKIHS